MARPKVLFLILLVGLLPGPLQAQTTRSLESYRQDWNRLGAEIADLETRLAQQNEQVREVEQQRQRIHAEAAAAREGLARLDMERVSGVYAAGWSRYFGSEEAFRQSYAAYVQQLDTARETAELKENAKPGADRAHDHLAGLRDATAEALANKRLEKAELYMAAMTDHEPAYVESIVMRDGLGKVHYSASWSPGELDRKIARLHAVKALMEATDLYEKRLQVQFSDAETRLKEADARWQELNATFQHLLVGDYVLRTLLEVADAAIAVVSAGEGAPAALLFEAGYRTWEAFTRDERIRPFMTLPESLIALRQAYADSLDAGGQDADPRRNRAVLARPPLIHLAGRIQTAERAPLGLYRSEKDELVKAGIEIIAGAVIDRGLAAAAARRVARAERLVQHVVADTLVVWPNGMVFPKPGYTIDMTFLAPKDYLVSRMKDLGRAGERAMEATFFDTSLTRWSTQGDRLMGKLTENDLFKSKAKDVLKGLTLSVAVTAAKEAVLIVPDAALQDVYIDMALAELDWFQRRNTLRGVRLMLDDKRDYKLELSRQALALFDDLCAADTCRRRLTVASASSCTRGIALTDAFNVQPVSVEVLTHRDMPAPAFVARLRQDGARDRLGAPLRALQSGGVGTAPEAQSSSRFRRDYFIKPDFKDRLHHGFDLEIAGPEAPEARAFDANPATVARLDGSLNWVDLDPGADVSHGLNSLFHAEVKILADPVDEAPRIPAGGLVGVQYVAPFEGQGQVRIAVRPTDFGDGGRPPLALAALTTANAQLPLDHESTWPLRAGRGQVQAPLDPGEYEIVMYERSDGRIWARAPFVVEPVPAPPTPAAGSMSLRLSGDRAVVGRPLTLTASLPDAPDLTPMWHTTNTSLVRLADGYVWDLHPDYARLGSAEGIRVDQYDMPGDYAIVYRHADTVLAVARFRAHIEPLPGALRAPKTDYRPGEAIHASVTLPADRYANRNAWAPQVTLSRIDRACGGNRPAAQALAQDWAAGTPSALTFKAPEEPGRYVLELFDRTPPMFVMDQLPVTVSAGP